MLERLETKGPIVTCGVVHKNEGIFESSDQGTISKGNVNVNFIKVS
jgi:hypothetical protein